MSKALTVQQFVTDFKTVNEGQVTAFLGRPASKINLKAEKFWAATEVYLARCAQDPKRDLLKCDRVTLMDALLKCASDGLVPDGQHAAIVPFWDSATKRLLAQYLPMVKGIMKRARELGEVWGVDCEAVFEKDDFFIDLGDPSVPPRHVPPKKGKRGDVVGAWAVFRDRNRLVIHREYMDREQIDKARNFSKAKNSPAWNDWFSEMARKTVIRRGSKYVPCGDEMSLIVNREDEYSLIEGKAIELTASRTSLAEPTLDDFDEEGNLRGAEPPRISQKAQAAAKAPTPPPYVEDAEIIDDEDAFGPDADDKIDPVVAFTQALKPCTTREQMEAVRAQFKGHFSTRGERDQANDVWNAKRRDIAVTAAPRTEAAE